MPSLVLCSQDPIWKPEFSETFESLLRSKGFISAPGGDHGADNGAEGYVAGEKFLSLIMFLGCSPQIDLNIQILLRYCDDVTFISSKKRPTVRCPKCRAEIKPFSSVSYSTLITCLKCGKTVSENNLDWRQVATWSSCYIEVPGIYPHEAVPSDALLKILESYTMQKWRTVYIS